MNKCYNSVDLAEAVSSDLWSGSEDPVGADGTIKGVEEAAGASEGSTGGVAGAVGLAVLGSTSDSIERRGSSSSMPGMSISALPVSSLTLLVGR